jgi:hypothetical protein
MKKGHGRGMPGHGPGKAAPRAQSLEKVEGATARIDSIEARLSALERQQETRLAALEKQQAEILTLLRTAVRPDRPERELARAESPYKFQSYQHDSDDEEGEDRD